MDDPETGEKITEGEQTDFISYWISSVLIYMTLGIVHTYLVQRDLAFSVIE